MTNRKYEHVTPEIFVKAWQAGSSTQDVAQKLDMPIEHVRSRASSYRNVHGIPLKKFGGAKKLDVEYLKTLCE